MFGKKMKLTDLKKTFNNLKMEIANLVLNVILIILLIASVLDRNDFKNELKKMKEEDLLILQKIKSLHLNLIVHPDTEPNSEFADRISDLEEIMDILNNR